IFFFFFSSRRRHTRFSRDWSSDVCSSDLPEDFRKRILRMEMELNERKKFDYFIENSVLEKAVEDAKSLIKKIIKGEDDGNSTHRSEERRVGKECRSRWTRNE